jgi:hypothetical protein
MTAVNNDIVIWQGAIFEESIIYKDAARVPIDLTGYSAKMQIRPYIGSSEVIDTLISGEELTITGASGKIDIEIDATVTASYNFTEAVYDLEVTPPSGATGTEKLLYGKVKLIKEVTL